MAPEAPAAGWQPLTNRRTPRARTASGEAFLRLAVTHAVVVGADAMVTVALAKSIFFSTPVDQARWRVLLSLLLTMAPFAVVAPFLGPAIDRSKGGRRLMVAVSSAGRCLVALFMAKEVAYRDVGHLALFLAAGLMLLILSKAHAVAKSSLVPVTVDSPADLVKAGGRLAVLAALAGFAGGLVGACVSGLFGADWVLRTAAVTYACGAVLAVRIRPAAPAQPSPADHVDEEVRSRGVSLAATGMATLRAISGFLTFAVAFLFRRTGAPAWWYGVVIAMAILGGFLGNLAGPALRQRVREERILTLTLAGLCLAALVAAFSGSRPFLACIALVVGLADGTGQLAFDAILQRDGAEGTRGRSFARYEATFQLLWVVGALLPVAVPLAGWLVALVIAVAAGAGCAYYIAGRRVVEHLAHRPPPPPPDRPGPPPPDRHESSAPAPRRNPYRARSTQR